MRLQQNLRSSIAVWAALMAFFITPSLQAQQAARPVVTLSVKPLDNALRDISYVLRACNVPEMSGLVTIMANQYSQGLDRSRPLGALVTISEEGMPTPVIFLPVVSVDQFFQALAAIAVEHNDLGDGLYELDNGSQVFYAKQQGQWLYITQTEQATSELPEDPQRLLGELPQRYDLAIRLSVQAFPENLKQMALEQIRIGVERNLATQTNASDTDPEDAKRAAENSLKQVEQFFRDTDQLTIGWQVDQPGQQTSVDFVAQFVPGSELARQVEQNSNLLSDYGQLIWPDAAAHLRFTSKMTDETDKQVAKDSLRDALTRAKQQIASEDDASQKIKNALNKLFDELGEIAEKTIDEGIFDAAFAVRVLDGKLQFQMAGRVADGNAFAASLQQAFKDVSTGDEAVDVQFNYANHGGFSLHRVSGPLPANDPARDLFGEDLTIVVATASKSLIVTGGADAEATVKSTINALRAATPGPATPLEMVVHITPLLQLVQRANPNPMVDMAIEKASQFAGNDTLRLIARTIPRGVVYQLSVDEGVLQAIGAVLKAASGQQQGF